jgi:hypothetical protein
LFVNHLPNWQLTFEHERELQTVVVARTIEEIAIAHDGLRVVLAGDLDATPEAAWGSTHPGEAGHTFTAENWELRLGRRIDHVMVRAR